MKTLCVLCHPSRGSLSAHLADHTVAYLRARGHDVILSDLYAEGYDPCLSAAEKDAYHTPPYVDTAELQGIEALVMIFPTWWSGMPAKLKGWVDRSFLPGVAFDVDAATGALHPRLMQLQQVLVITTLGGPAWIDRLVLRRPLYRVLKWGLLKPCAPKARFRMLSLYGAETITEARLTLFTRRITRQINKWGHP
jgi:putative NADPH-quinone reductase